MEQPSKSRLVEIVKEAELWMAMGIPISKICEDLKINEQTLTKWQKEYNDNIKKRDTGELNMGSTQPIPIEHFKRIKRFWLFEIWDEYRETFKALIAHTLIYSLLLGLLVLSHIIINYLDYPADRKELFDKIHFSGYVTVLIIFLLSFIIKLLAFEYRGLRK